MANYTKSFNFRNGVQVDDTNFVISPDGLVGIGTSQPNKSLDVYGDSRVSGIASFSHIGVVGVVTVGTAIKLDASTGVIEATSFSGDLSGAGGIVAIATAGWIQQNVGLTTTGNVGIKTTEFNNYELQVGNDPVSNIGVGIKEGVLTVSGLTTTNDLYVSGVSTFIGDINADGGVDIDGHTELDDVNVSGASTFTGNIDANGDIDVDGHTNLDNVSIAGVTTTSGALDAQDIIKGYKYTAAPYGSTTTITVTVADKTSAHRYNGQGSSKGYVFDGLESPFLTLTPGRTYKFDQSHNTNSTHQIKFYLEGDKTGLYETGVTYNGTAGNAGAYTQIAVGDQTPVVLHYMCVNHGYMGNSAQLNSNVVNTNYDATLGSHLNVAGVSTFNDDIVIKNGSDIKVNWDKADNKFTFSQNVKAVFDDGDGDTSPGLEISHSGTDSLIQDYGEGNFILKTSSSTFKILGNNTEPMIVANPNEDVQLFNDNVLKFNTVSTGASVYGQINVASLNGGTSTLSTKSGSLKYGNEVGAYDYSTRKSFDVLNNDIGNINFYIDYANVSTADTGSFYWHKGTSSRLMALTYDGKLGIGITLPEHELHVSGASTITGNSFFGSNLNVKSDLNVDGNIVCGNFNGNVSGTLLGNANSTSGVSTFYKLEVTNPHSNFAGIGIGTTNSYNYSLEILGGSKEEETLVFVNLDGNIGIGTTRIDEGVNINASKKRATLGSVGIGTTSPQSAIDFRYAGREDEGIFANRMYMYPPLVNNAQEGNLTGMEEGAIVYNTQTHKLRYYNESGAWANV